MKFSIKGFFSKYDQIGSYPQETADLVTFTEEIFNRKLHFLCSEAFLSSICKLFFPEFTV